MRHPIDPKVDCVFKALLGAERNRALLSHFLNAILGDALPGPITDTEILNPYNDKEFIDDKLSKRWLKFFNEAEQLDDHALPAWMQTGEMQQAMNTLKAFSEMVNYGIRRAFASNTAAQ